MIQEKLGLDGALKICKFWNNGALKNTLLRLKYNQERFRKVFAYQTMKFGAFL